MISTIKALQDLVEQARSAKIVAIDTEFVWERTYYPILGVVQVGLSEEDVFLIDTVELTNLELLGELLADASVVKIFHDAIQDLTILRRATGSAPQNVFDTQRASGFVGLNGTISLQDLVTESTGITLRKGETRTNWCKRPLSAKQLDYAEDDVRYMPGIYSWLLERGEAEGRVAWMMEEMKLLDNPLLYDEPDPRLQFERVKARGIGALSDTQRAVLRELTAWRELEARASDKTRRAVLADDALADIARRLPKSVNQLSNRTVSDRERDLHGKAIMDAIELGLAIPAGERPRRLKSHPDEDRISARVLVVQAGIAGRCAREGIDPRIVASKVEIRDLVISDESLNGTASPLLEGWRKEFVGDDVIALLSGEAAVRLGGVNDWPQLMR